MLVRVVVLKFFHLILGNNLAFKKKRGRTCSRRIYRMTDLGYTLKIPKELVGSSNIQLSLNS